MTFGQMDYRKIDSRSKLRKLGESKSFLFLTFAGHLDTPAFSPHLTDFPRFTISPVAELEAYSSLVNAFRAQGNFTKEKKKILNELRSFLR